MHVCVACLLLSLELSAASSCVCVYVCVYMCVSTQMRELFMALAMGPVNGLVWDKQKDGDLVGMACDMQLGLFTAPIYFPGTAW